MNARSLSILGSTMLTLATSLGGYAFLTEAEELGRVGMLVSVPAATVLVVGALRQHSTVNDDRLADAHRAGYTLALDHVARGLLDQPTVPTGGGDQLAEVRTLPAPRRTDERAAG